MLAARLAELAPLNDEVYAAGARARSQLPGGVDEESRRTLIGTSLERAAAFPLAIAEAASNVAELAAVVAEDGDPTRAAPTRRPPRCSRSGRRGAAAHLVEINLGVLEHDDAAAARDAARGRRRGSLGADAGRRAVTAAAHESEHEELPAWSLPADAVDRVRLELRWPERVTREWAFERLDRRGRPRLHPRQRRRGRPPARRRRCKGGTPSRSTTTASRDRREDEEGDICGHGTACAGIVRALAPDCELTASACSAPATPAAAR